MNKKGLFVIFVALSILICLSFVFALKVIDETDPANPVTIMSSGTTWTIPEAGEIWVTDISAGSGNGIDTTLLIDKIDGDKRVIAQRDMEVSGLSAGYNYFCFTQDNSDCRCTQRDATFCTNCDFSHECFTDTKFVVAKDEIITDQFESYVQVHYIRTCECSSTDETSCSGTDYLTCDDGCLFTNNGEVEGECGYTAPIICDPSQVILKLSATTNAHGEVWSQTNYPISICYDKIFGADYTGANPHSCSSSNRILSLNAETNAHASLTHDSTYNIDVCYGDLTCRTTTGSCNADEKLIVSLSSAINAHLANDSSDSSYTTKRCCKSFSSEISDAYFASMNDQAITQADLKDSVKLVVLGTELENITFTIKKNVAFWFDKTITTSSSTSGGIIWPAGRKSDGTFSGGDYYFIAEIPDGSSLESGILEVGEEENSVPEIQILSPLDKQIYFLGELLNFSSQVYDEDDKLYYSWTLGDGTTKLGNSETKGNSSFEYTYSSPGQKNIMLTAWNSRNQEVKSRVSIMVVNSSYLLAYIDTPNFGEGYGRIVRFNASSSYAVDYNHASGEIVCLMGDCPGKTEGCPPGSGTKPGCQISLTGTPKGYDNANFTWVFDSDSRYNRTGSGLSNVIFDRLFPGVGEHTASLTISVNPISSIETKFSIFFNEPVCAYNGEDSYWYLPSGQILASFDSCYLADADDSCCPEHYSCYQESDSDPGMCLLDDKLACSDYFAEAECIQDSSNVAEPDVEFKTEDGFCTDYSQEISESCWEYSDNCRCYWNVSSETCDSAYTIKTECAGEAPEIEGDCIFTTSESTDCSLGYRFFQWEAEWTGIEDNPDCVSGEDQVPCLSETLLGFFSKTGFIIVIVLLVIVYWIITHNKKHHSSSKRKKKR